MRRIAAGGYLVCLVVNVVMYLMDPTVLTAVGVVLFAVCLATVAVAPWWEDF